MDVMNNPSYRGRGLKKRKTALLIVDVQNYVAALGKGEHKDVTWDNIPEKLRYYFSRIEHQVLPNIKRLQDACRENDIEVLFTVVENLTKDGRDRSLDYKITGLNVPKGSEDAKVVETIAPLEDEIVFPKTTSSVFNSTTIDYVLRNLGVEDLIITGLLTDQCVESSVRDACDKGYIVKVPEDACGTYSQEQHDQALSMYGGYCHVCKTDDIIKLIET